MPPRKRTVDPTTVITYRRVSTDEQADSGLGLDAQRDKLATEVEQRGWTSVGDFPDEGISAKTIEGRPQLLAALELLDTGGAANLMVMKLDRLSRSVHDFTGLLDRSVRKGWNLVVLDLGIDTNTPNGKFMAHVIASVAQLERELIGERTSAALQAKKRAGAVLGRRQRAEMATVELIHTLRDQGRSLQWIADWLMTSGINPAQGGISWYPSSVKAVLDREDVR